MRNSRWYPRSDGSRRDSKVSKEVYDSNWDNIFGKKDKPVEEAEEQSEPIVEDFTSIRGEGEGKGTKVEKLPGGE